MEAMLGLPPKLYKKNDKTLSPTLNSETLNKNIIQNINETLEKIKKSMSNDELQVYHCLEKESKLIKSLYTSNFNQKLRLELIKWRNSLPKFAEDSNKNCKDWDKYIHNNCSDSNKKILIKYVSDIIDTIKNHDKKYELCYEGFRISLMLTHAHHATKCGEPLLKRIGEWKQACTKYCFNRLQSNNRTTTQAVQGGSNNSSIKINVQKSIHLASGSEANSNHPSSIKQRDKEKQFKCDTCEQTFKESNDLTKHKKIHTKEKSFLCDQCGDTFSQFGNLNRHKMTHTGEKPYQCDICEKRFRHSGNLSDHKMTHTGEKPYQCGICKKRFIGLSNLNKHKRIHTGEKPYQCDICEKRFRYSGNLSDHKMTHGGEKPHKCDTCQKEFTQPGNLKTHKRTHTGEKPYKCDTCQKEFTQSGNLKTHKRTHTEEKPY